jgi:hypothetical protein
VHAILEDGNDFKEFCPDWRDANIWEEWRKFGVKCFSEGLKLLMPTYDGLTMRTDPVERAVEEEDPAKMKSRPIPVPLDADGFPELPPTTSNDPHKTKVVQSMLREYCVAHARELQCN